VSATLGRVSLVRPPRLASRLDTLKPSATASFFQKAAELQARGIEILPFGVGEPDFATPAHICRATEQALAEGKTRYTAVRGISALREAICADSARRRGGVLHRPSEVVVSVGAKHTLFNLCFALLGPGDEAIIPAPCWVSYPDQCRLAGAEPVIVETRAEQGFKLTAEGLQAALTPRTRAIFLCTPNNPTGAAYSRDELSELAHVLRTHDTWIIVDEIYAGLVYEGFAQHSLLEVAPDLRERLIIVDGVSKRFAMTGFRIGWALMPEAVAQACDTLQGQMTTSPTTIAQYAALAALTGPEAPVEQMRGAFEQRRRIVLSELAALGLPCRAPEGAFYAFIDVRAHLGRILFGRLVSDDTALAELLLEEIRCSFVPGSAFLTPGYLRMSHAASEAQLREGLARLARALA
jgi:aspartate aminotransferase